MRKVLMSAMALLLCAFAVAPVIATTATKTPFTAVVCFTPGTVSQGEQWTTEDGILHIKGMISEGTVILHIGGASDLSGAFWVTHSEAFDLNTGEGANHGKFVITVAEGDVFEGSFQGMITEGYRLSGTFVGQGTGAYEGKKMMGSFEGVMYMDTRPPVVELVFEGMILSPKG